MTDESWKLSFLAIAEQPGDAWTVLNMSKPVIAFAIWWAKLFGTCDTKFYCSVKFGFLYLNEFVARIPSPSLVACVHDQPLELFRVQDELVACR